MTRICRLVLSMLAAALMSGLSSAAHARCTINAAGLSITPVTASTGVYTPPAAPVAQSVTFTISGTYNSTNNTFPLCGVALSFNRASLPATMARSGGGATMPYTIRTLPGGGNTLLFTGGGLPAAANTLQVSFTQAGTNLTNRAFSITMTAHFLAQPGSPQAAGTYSDALTARVYQVRQGTGALTLRLTRAFTVTGTVNKACTIGGLSTPGMDTANIPVSALGSVNTAVISRSYLTVICNALSNLQVTSQGGAVKRATAAPSGFTHLINYSATATYSGATSTVNTATISTAVGPEAGSIGTTSTNTSSGTMAVSITPQATVQPLVQGDYADTLRIQITPQ
ncbi:MAG: hypothetical protein HOP09_09390 [Hyphomicrobium sp.]|nr:hypothetical protein [Hyphomicrobium sp.]